MSLSETERTFLSVGAAVALDHAAHHGAIRYLGMPARNVALAGLGISVGAYYTGMGVSYLINEDEGVSDYRYAIDTILGSPGGAKEIQQKTILNLALAVTPTVVDFIDDVDYAVEALVMGVKHILRTGQERKQRILGGPIV